MAGLLRTALGFVTVWFFLAGWLCGLVLAKGFFPALFCVFFPPWAWYLCAERGLQIAGWIK